MTFYIYIVYKTQSYIQQYVPTNYYTPKNSINEDSCRSLHSLHMDIGIWQLEQFTWQEIWVFTGLERQTWIVSIHAGMPSQAIKCFAILLLTLIGVRLCLHEFVNTIMVCLKYNIVNRSFKNCGGKELGWRNPVDKLPNEYFFFKQCDYCEWQMSIHKEIQI